jgi:hypothetical protein
MSVQVSEFAHSDIISSATGSMEQSTTAENLDTDFAMTKVRRSPTNESERAISQNGFSLVTEPSLDGAPYLIYLNAAQLDRLCRNPDVQLLLPNISKAQLEDMSKGDFFVKGTAVVQVLWLLVTILVRAGKKLPIAQLELAVLAYAVCSFIAYLFSWSKPQDVKVAIVLQIDRPLDVATSWRLSDVDYCGESIWRQLFSHEITSATRTLEDPIPNEIFYDHMSLIWDLGKNGDGPSLRYPHIYIITLAAGVLFGALHCIAWKFHFPTPVERLLWRVSSVFLAGSPPLYLSTLTLTTLTRQAGASCGMNFAPLTGVFFKYFSMVLTALYVAARLFIMVELFRSLLFLEPDAFVTTWSLSVPHIG